MSDANENIEAKIRKACARRGECKMLEIFSAKWEIKGSERVMEINLVQFVQWIAQKNFCAK